MSVNDKIVFDSEPPKELIQAIAHIYRSGDFGDVLVKVTYLLAQFPSSILLLNFCGVCHVKFANLDTAIEVYKTILALNPNDESAYFSMAKIYYEKNNFDEAITAFKRALEINPFDAETLNSLGMCLQDKGDLDNSLKMFQKAIDIKPEHLDALNNIKTIKTQLI